jgi:hypothetical protein
VDIIKGFVTIDQYIVNVPGEISLIGELSTVSRTYSKEKGEYTHTDVSGYNLVTFRAVDNAGGAPIEVAPSQVKEILQVVKECVNYTANHIRPYDPVDFRNEVANAFYQQISSFSMGALVDNGTIALPEWVSWISTGHDGSEIKVWLADQAFQNQYDEYSITVVPPLEPIDQFFGSYPVVSNLLSSMDLEVFGDRIQDAKDGNPETVIRILKFDFYNRVNINQKTPSDWAVLIYGKTGDNIDAIKDALVEYILENSTHPQNEWEEIFPDIFKRTEFYMLPRWDFISIPNLTVLSSLYSSILDPKEVITFAKTAISQFPANFVENNIATIPYDYKAVSFVTVAGIGNTDGNKKIKEIFPDYIPVPSTSTDFSRMSIKTRNWILMLENLLLAAETATEFSAIPGSLRRQKKAGILYISKMYEGVNYLVAARANAIYGN